MKRVRIKGTGQVLDMAPGPAIAMINGGTAEEVNERNEVIRAGQIETQMLRPAAEHAVAPAQHVKGKSRRSA